MSLPSYIYGETIGDSGSIPIANHPPSSPGHCKEENIPTDVEVFMTSELGYDPREITITELWNRVSVELKIPVTQAANEIALAGPVTAHMTQTDESLTLQQEPSAYLQDVQDTPTSFPTLDVFAPRVSGLVPYPSIDPRYYSVQPSPILPATEYIAHPYPDATMDIMTVHDTAASYASESDGPSSSTPNGIARGKRPKRKARQDSEDTDGSSSSALAPTTSKRRCIDNEEIGEGAFGPYTSADASATVMPAPHFNPKPVDISGRRTLGHENKVLRTRKYGAMELDDSYSGSPVKITQDLPAGMTCVRSCDWTDQPCGLYVEVNGDHIAAHNLHWHGVQVEGTAKCKFKGCLDETPKKNKKLCAHIESVHYAASHECPYCKRRYSRGDAVKRHQDLNKCEPLRSKLALAKQQDRAFIVEESKKIVHGYIVPARHAS